MKRISEIIKEVQGKDEFFSEFKQSCQLNPEKKKSFQILENALMSLDDESWNILKEKVIEHYTDHRSGQQKQAFFNILNEAFAYQYLKNKGYLGLKFLKESSKKTPDITYKMNNKDHFCEVKTLGISDQEISRRKNGEVIDCSIYTSLGNGFLKKFKDGIETAKEQIKVNGADSNGLVFIIIKFDDFTWDYYDNYKKEMQKFCRNNDIPLDEFVKLDNFSIAIYRVE